MQRAFDDQHLGIARCCGYVAKHASLTVEPHIKVVRGSAQNRGVQSGVNVVGSDLVTPDAQARVAQYRTERQRYQFASTSRGPGNGTLG